MTAIICTFACLVDKSTRKKNDLTFFSEGIHQQKEAQTTLKMSGRFKASKYKNAAPLEVKKEEHIKDLAIGSYNSCGNYIDAR